MRFRAVAAALALTQAARDRVGASVVPTEQLLRVQSLLADYRTQHR